MFFVGLSISCNCQVQDIRDLECEYILYTCLPTHSDNKILDKFIIFEQAVGSSDDPYFTEQRSSTEGNHFPIVLRVRHQGHLQTHTGTQIL